MRALVVGGGCRGLDLARELGDAVNLDDGGRDEAPHGGFLWKLQLLDPCALCAHAFDVCLDTGFRIRRDHRTDIGTETVGPPDRKHVHRALEHVERALGDILLQAEHPQRGAALSGTVEGGRDHIRNDLLGEGRGVDDHGILAAGFGNERNGLAGG